MDRAEEQAQQWRGLLKEEGGTVLCAALSEWEWPSRPGLDEAVAELVGWSANGWLACGRAGPPPDRAADEDRREQQ